MIQRTFVILAAVALAFSTVPVATMGSSSGTITVCASGCDASTIQGAIDTANPGQTIEIQPGTYAENLDIETDDLTILGAGQDEVTIDATGSPGTYGIAAEASGLTLSGFTLAGPADSYGIKAQVLDGSPPDITDLTLEDITVQGSGVSEVDLHGVSGGLVSNVTALGQGTSGVGLAITDSHDITVEDLTTSGNTWGGFAIFTSGAFVPGGTSGITLTGDNDLSETARVYTQTHDDENGDPIPITDLDFQGFGIEATFGSAPAFTFFYESFQAGLDAVPELSQDSRFALETATVENPTSGLFLVSPPMSIQAAVDAAELGETVQLTEGVHTEQVSVDKGVSIEGTGAIIEAPSSMDTDADGRSNIVTVSGTDTTATIQRVTIRGPAPGSCGSLDSGIAVRDGAHAFLLDNTIEAIRADPVGGCQNGVGVTVGHIWYDDSESTASAIIEGNEIRDFQKSAVVVAGDGSEATIEDNAIACSGHAVDDIIAQDAIQLWQHASADILSNTISDCNSTFNGAPRGVGIHLSEGTHDTTIQANRITNTQTGIALMNFAPWSAADERAPATDLVIEGNQLSGGDGGIYLAGSGENVTVEANEVTDEAVFGIFVGPDTWLADPPEFTNVDILGNTLHANPSPSVLVRDSAAETELHYNRFTGETLQELALVNEDDATLDATHNWWDSVFGPTHDDNPFVSTIPGKAPVLTFQEVQGDVTFSPWCEDTDCLANNVIHGLSPHPLGPGVSGAPAP